VFPNTLWLANTNHESEKTVNYVRSQRLRWGLSQGELRAPVGMETRGRRVTDRKEASPSDPQVRDRLFHFSRTAAAELFPDISASMRSM